jgi:CheY-like chemotaxis protein
VRILWVDDEIEGFKPHILFLEKEGVEVKAVDHPEKAIEILERETFDLILLDYRMPGLDGIETFKKIKRIAPHIPVALVTMVTDKEIIEASVAEEAFDYLVKPVQPSQILALIKRLEAKEIKLRKMGEKIVEIYRELTTLPQDYEGWLKKSRLLYEWKLDTPDETVDAEFSAQNNEFARWIERNYPELIRNDEFVLSHNLLRKKILPLLKGGKVALFVFDNFRMDQFMRIVRNLPRSLKITQEQYMANLPTATPYARNSIFAGKLPIEIEKRHPGWLEDNRHEKELLSEQLMELGFERLKFSMTKINALKELQELKVGSSPFEIFVVNFIDLLSHLRQDIDALKDLAPDGKAFIRWGEYVLEEANIFDKIERLAGEGYTIFLTSDHGWVETTNPLTVLGGEELTTGLRYKFGDSVRLGGRGGILIRDLPNFGLPQRKGKGRLALATGYTFFVYPSDPHRFEKVYMGGIYHGGITLEEMVIPLIRLESA